MRQPERYGKLFVLLQLAGHFSLLPLLHEARETTLKLLLVLIYHLGCIHFLRERFV
jgi:hypothetical protein